MAAQIWRADRLPLASQGENLVLKASPSSWLRVSS